MFMRSRDADEGRARKGDFQNAVSRRLCTLSHIWRTRKVVIEGRIQATRRDYHQRYQLSPPLHRSLHQVLQN